MTPRPPIWIRAGYYLLGTRVPKRWHEWLVADIGRPGWHKWVPRLRITFVLVFVIVAFTGPWTAFWPLVTIALVALCGVLWIGKAGTGEEQRRIELMFQKRTLGWDSRIGALTSALAIGSATQGEVESAGQHTTSHVAEPLDESGIQNTCKWCGERIQLEGDVWHHRDPDWVLFECPDCGWQDVESIRCPACGRQDLVKTAGKEAASPRGRRVAFAVYVVGFVGLVVWWVLTQILQS